jgi:hypothetical protein
VQGRKTYEGYKLLSITPENNLELGLMRRLWQQNEDNGGTLDFWIPPTHVGGKIQVLISPEDLTLFVDRLKEFGIKWVVGVENLAASLVGENEEFSGEGEIEEELGLVERARRKRGTKFNFKKYHRYDTIIDYLKKLEKKTNLVKLDEIGKTYENRSLVVVKVKSRRGPKKKPAVWIDGGIHAREWVSPAAVLYFITELVKGYKKRDKGIRDLLESADFYFLPMVNPDGYEYSHTDDRMWRKNRSPEKNCFILGEGPIEDCCYGVDLNRNFNWHHCRAGASRNPCSEIYCGATPFSEQESNALRKFVYRRRKRFKVFITIHSYAQIWMYPYGHKKNSFPNNADELKQVAEKAIDELSKVHGTKYTHGTGANTLYEASGGSDDWAKGKAKIEFTYLLELRPCEDCYAGFVLPTREIKPTCEETWAGVQTVVSQMVDKIQIRKNQEEM